MANGVRNWKKKGEGLEKNIYFCINEGMNVSVPKGSLKAATNKAKKKWKRISSKYKE